MPTAFLIKDTVELDGVLDSEIIGSEADFFIQLGNSGSLGLIYFKDGIDTSAFQPKQKIHFSAKAVYENEIWNYYDAEIME